MAKIAHHEGTGLYQIEAEEGFFSFNGYEGNVRTDWQEGFLANIALTDENRHNNYVSSFVKLKIVFSDIPKIELALQELRDYLEEKNIKVESVSELKERITQETLQSEKDNLEQEKKTLWNHLVSEHACITNLEVPFDELLEIHKHEHQGSCGIRNHPETNIDFDKDKIIENLQELL